MKVGIDASSLSAGRGPARYTRGIIKALGCISRPSDEYIQYSPFADRVEDLPENFRFCQLPLQKKRPWLNWTLPMAARRDNLDVMFFPANDCWLWRAVPAVVTLLDVAQFTTLYGNLPSWKDRLQIRLQMGRIGKVADTIITISKYSAYEIGKVVPGSRGKTEVVYCGLSDPFNNGYEARGSVENPYILFVGGFDRRKNLERLLQAFKALLEKGRKETLVLIGAGGANGKLYYDMPALVEQYGLGEKVAIKNGVSDGELPAYYANASLFIFPSIVEGFGFPIIEAQACGCPVACSNAASMPEVGGDAAVYFDPFDVNQMEKSLTRVLVDKEFAQELRVKGLKNCQRFQWKDAGKKVYDVLKGNQRIHYSC